MKPQPCAILEAEPVGADFHARFSATSRGYLYRILNRRAPPTLDVGRVWTVGVALDAAAIHAAAQALVGRHASSSFRAAACQAAAPVKPQDCMTVQRLGEIGGAAGRGRV